MVTYRKDEKQRPDGWNKGAPPHVGWWLAKDPNSTGRNEWRFWCGQNWSIFCSEKEDGADGNIHTDYSFEKISWTWTWHEHARVARVNPETGEVTGSGPCPYETNGQAWPFSDVKKKAADAPKLKKKPGGNRKVTQYVLMNNARPIYVADSLQELHDRIKAMPRISWTHYEKLRNRKKA